MRLLLTGQIGLDKKQYLAEVAAIAQAQGEPLRIYNIGDMMYAEAPDVPAGRILDLPLSRLNSLRRAVFRDVLADLPNHKHAILNTHATFRWKHGLFAAFDFDQLALFNADLYVTLVDNIETIHARLLRDQSPRPGGDGNGVDHSLKDLMVWREEEILATEILARAPSSSSAQTPIASKFLVLSRGRRPNSTAETLFRLIFRPHMKKVYPSFPMTHVADLPDALAEIDAFRAAIAGKFIAFDPGDVDEKLLADAAIRAAQNGHQFLTIPHPLGTGPDDPDASQKSIIKNPPPPPHTPTLSLKTSDLLTILPDIDGQIYARDFLLVRQSDMIVSYIPELPPPVGSPAGALGKPGLSSGVERELQHAHDHGKDVYVIWKPRKDPSPFITQTANRVFRSVEEALEHFDQKGYFSQSTLF